MNKTISMTAIWLICGVVLAEFFGWWTIPAIIALDLADQFSNNRKKPIKE